MNEINHFISKFADNNDLLVPIILSILTILLAFNDKADSKSFQKKYLIVNYIIIFLQIVYYKGSIIHTILILMLLMLLSGINISYTNKNNFLENELSWYQYLVFHIEKSFFLMKLYILFICVALLYCIKKISMVGNFHWDFVMLLCIILFSIYHLIQNASDHFGTKLFYDVRQFITIGNREGNTKKFLLELKNEPIQKEEILELLIFILYMEDRYMFERKSPNERILRIIFSKKSFVTRNIGREISNMGIGKNHKKNIVVFNIFNMYLRMTISKMLYLLKKRDFKEVKRYIIKIFKKYFRGYSTIQTQYVRVSGMLENSYKYTIRRKIFVEWIYTRYFYKAWGNYLNNINFYKKNKKEKNLFYMKAITLISYYTNVLQAPKNKDELFKKFRSRISLKYYEKKFEELKTNEQYKIYKLEIEEILNDAIIKYIANINQN